MFFIDDNEFEGTTFLSRVFHKPALEDPLSSIVRTLQVLLKDLTGEEHTRFSASGASRSMQVTSLGSGLAREVSAFTREEGIGGVGVHWPLHYRTSEQMQSAGVCWHRRG